MLVFNPPVKHLLYFNISIKLFIHINIKYVSLLCLYNWHKVFPEGVIYTRTIAHCPRCQKTTTQHYFLTCMPTENNISVTLLICVTDTNSFLRGVIYTKKIAHLPRDQKKITPHHFLTCSHTWSCSEINNSVTLCVCINEYSFSIIISPSEHSSYDQFIT